MSRRQLYVANLPPGLDLERLAELFASYGEVTEVEPAPPDPRSAPAARVAMAVEKAATRALIELNGHALDGHRLAVSHVEVDLAREMTAKQRAAATELATALGETEKVPVRQIEMMVRQCGPAFAHALLAEATEIEAGEGMMTKDGSRRRSLGGVFFALATARMSPAVRFLIVNRKGKPPSQAGPRTS